MYNERIIILFLEFKKIKEVDTCMELLYKEEHLNCYVYDQENPTIQHIQKREGEVFSLQPVHTQIIFLLKGKINYSFEYHPDNIFEEGTFRLFPQGCQYAIETEKDSELVLINMHNEINFCNHFPLEMLYELNRKTIPENLYHPLKINEMISYFLNGIVKTVSDGLKCTYFHELKQKEALFYLRAYYSKEELFAFFAPMLNNGITFSNMIYKNYESVKEIGELAKITNYSLSGFKKRFMRVFGSAPAIWMEKEKAKKIYSEINCTQKSFKELSVEYNFSSPAHFNGFCKRVYGMSPGALRESTKNQILFGN